MNSPPEYRLAALDRAISYHDKHRSIQHGMAKQADVIRTAEMFSKFIERAEVPQA